MTSPGSQARARWVTLLDAALLLSASAALVLALGARTRFDLAGIRVTIRSPANLIIATAVLAAIRVMLGRRLPFLPAVPRSALRPLEIERDRFASPPPVTPRVRLCAAATLLGSIVWIVPHIVHPRMVPDPGDPLFSAWRIARIAHQLTTDPRHLFDGNVFYPLPLTLTLSDSTFLQAMLGAPFVLAGIDPLLVANALTLVAFPACGLAFFYAGWRITGDPYAGVVTGLLGAWYPFHTEHYSHLELHWVMFAPLAIVWGMRMLAQPGFATGVWFGAAIGAQWLASMYLGVMLLLFLVPFLGVIACGWRVRLSKPLRRAAAGVCLVALPAFVLLGIPYMQGRAVRGERQLQEVRDGSAMPADYGHAPPKLIGYAWENKRDHKIERELMPGITTLAFAAAGAVPPLSGAAIASLVAGAMAFDLSLGLNGLVYDELYRGSAVFRGMRITARFSVIVGVALIVLAGIGVARVLRRVRHPRLQAGICATCALAVLIDLRMDPRLQEYPAEIPAIYSAVTSDMVLVEMPVDNQIDFMYFSTRHWARTVGGYSGFPRYTEALMDAWKAWPSPDSVGYFKLTGATHLTYNCALDQPGRCARILEMLAAHTGLEPVASALWQGKETRLYRIR